MLSQWLTSYVPRFSLPDRISSDNSRQFVDKVVKLILQKLSIEQCLESVYHPQSQWVCEKNRLTKICQHTGLSWVAVLPLVLMACRLSELHNLRMTPHELVTGRQMPTPCLRMSGEGPSLSLLKDEMKSYVKYLNTLHGHMFPENWLKRRLKNNNKRKKKRTLYGLETRWKNGWKMVQFLAWRTIWSCSHHGDSSASERIPYMVSFNTLCLKRPVKRQRVCKIRWCRAGGNCRKCRRTREPPGPRSRTTDWPCQGHSQWWWVCFWWCQRWPLSRWSREKVRGYRLTACPKDSWTRLSRSGFQSAVSLRSTPHCPPLFL